MKPESYAWQRLREHAAAQLRPGFAQRVLQITHGSEAEREAWSRLQAEGAAQLRTGFAQRVLQAARAVTGPSLSRQFILSAATVAVCVFAVVFVHERSKSQENARNLAGWEQLAAVSQDAEFNP